MIRWGANLAPLTLTGEGWRLATSMFLHIGIVHLLFNMAVLLAWGPSAERYFGKFAFAVLYLFSGIAGGLLSAVWHGYHQVSSLQMTVGYQFVQTTRPDLIVSAGASGALMGLAGAFLAAKVFGHTDKFGELERVSGKNVALVVGMNLAYGFANSGIDNAAHIGGLLAGFALGTAFCWSHGLGKSTQYFVKGVLAALTLVSGIQGPAAFASSDLQDLKVQLVAELDAQQQKDQAEQEQRDAEKLAQEDEKQRAPSVSKEVAEGAQVAIGSGPSGFTVSADGKRLYVASFEANTVSVIDLASKNVVKTIGGKAQPIMGGCPQCPGVRGPAIAVSPDQALAYVADLAGDAVSVVDLHAGTVIGKVAVGSWPRAIALSSDGKFAYVLNIVDNTVSVIDTAAQKNIATLALSKPSTEGLPPGRPASLTLSADNQRLFVLDGLDNSLYVFDTAARRVLKQIPLPAEENAYDIKLQQGGKSLWVLSDNRFSLIDTAALALKKQLPLCEGTHGYSFDINADGTLIALPLNESQRTLLLRPATRKVVGALPAEHGPGAIRLLADNKSLLVMNDNAASVTLQDVTKTMSLKEAQALNDEAQNSEGLCWQTPGAQSAFGQ
ncbi:rhomboid family intramembrane serine protease [Paraherbaspirillum soli]|uniref:Rhomboid family intramembrane serine protease n=1 Tax=Paraherbaspirillum soli TaxID=631222 RepID=A0ABW0M791_9BURK